MKTKTINFQDLVGKTVIYISESSKEYEALITEIPPYPEHGYSPYPIVSLEFRDSRNKLVRKERVCPYQPKWMITQVYKLKG